MSKICLACRANVQSIFEPCPQCGTRPTDPDIRLGLSKDQYESEQNRHGFMQAVSARGQAASNLSQDLVTEVPTLYGQTAWACPDEVINAAHQQNLLKKNDGGVSEFKLNSKPIRLFGEKALYLYVFASIAWGLVNLIDLFLAS